MIERDQIQQSAFDTPVVTRISAGRVCFASWPRPLPASTLGVEWFLAHNVTKMVVSCYDIYALSFNLQTGLCSVQCHGFADPEPFVKAGSEWIHPMVWECPRNRYRYYPVTLYVTLQLICMAECLLSTVLWKVKYRVMALQIFLVTPRR